MKWRSRPMKPRFPVCYYFATLGAVTYVTCSILAFAEYPVPFSPWRNWLSDLGNQLTNPDGAAFYNVGVIATSVFMAVWFAGLSQWKLEHNMAHRRLLIISQCAGLFASFALIMSALNPINRLEVHSLWSQLHFTAFGISFGFSVSALRYHPLISKPILYVGICASVMPFLMFTIGQGKAYWMEWVAVASFIVYILVIGRRFRAQTPYAPGVS